MLNIILNRLRDATEVEKREICKHLKMKNFDTQDINEIANEYRKAAGHSVVNIIRKDQLPYKQILIDVADKLNEGLKWTSYKLQDSSTEFEIEEKIVQDIEHKAEKLKEKWMKLSPEKRKEKEDKLRDELAKEGYDKQAIKGVLALLPVGGIGVASATPVALGLFYSGTFGGLIASVIGIPTTTLMMASGISAGLVAAPLVIAYAGSPAYRKTIPVTIILIKIRKRVEMEKDL